jgi:hypothetical protein
MSKTPVSFVPVERGALHFSGKKRSSVCEMYAANQRPLLGPITRDEALKFEVRKILRCSCHKSQRNPSVFTISCILDLSHFVFLLGSCLGLMARPGEEGYISSEGIGQQKHQLS